MKYRVILGRSGGMVAHSLKLKNKLQKTPYLGQKCSYLALCFQFGVARVENDYKMQGNIAFYNSRFLAVL